MKLVLPGGSGHLGTVLARALARDGHEVVVLSRQVFDRGRGKALGAAPPPGHTPWRVVSWDGVSQGPWAAEIDGADVVINLAGRSVNCRYTPSRRREILESRLASTRAIGEAIAHVIRPPATWLQMSTATIYAHRYDAPNDELTGIIGGAERDAPETWTFSIDVATSWERVFEDARVPHTRKVAMRSAIVMHTERGGAFDVLLDLVRRGLGGTSGDGRQFVSWIHHADFVRAIAWLIDRRDIDGAVNLAAPHPLPNREFMRALREGWHARIGLPSPAWLLEIAAFFMRTESELVLKSRRVVPTRLLQGGFSFLWSEWPAAARDLCADWRRTRRATAL